MAENPYIYCLMIEVDPGRGQPYLDWLTGGHIEEVVRCRGFLTARMVRFEEKAGDGWDVYLVTYTLESRAALEGYWRSAFFKGFVARARDFEGTFRIRRFSGETLVAFG